jgi:hypothetical protein
MGCLDLLVLDKSFEQLLQCQKNILSTLPSAACFVYVTDYLSSTLSIQMLRIIIEKMRQYCTTFEAIWQDFRERSSERQRGGPAGPAG